MKISLLTVFSLIVSSLCFSQSKGSFIDERDGQRYNWIQFGDQIWMSENLNYDTRGAVIFDSQYGKAYTFRTSQRVCPSGWHLPSDSEWKELEQNLGMRYNELNQFADYDRESGLVGFKLKSRSGWQIYIGKSNGSDEIGFCALPGGYYHASHRRFLLYGTHISFWTTTIVDHEFALIRVLNSNSDGIGREECRIEHGCYVRCIKDLNNLTF